ncbi:hypothetical protein [Gordonia araii]|uniref:hypothetical protein n=1 Tax=Gordonia araii TaxID=263909 RepID=UPI0005914AB7|nr:hypothetical protein [Gordonia araii]NNG96619.1 hypothetical protein [Gordonia araii NBRC 100433]
MSENVYTYLSLDCSADEAPALVTDIADWLVSSGTFHRDEELGCLVANEGALSILDEGFTPGPVPSGIYGLVYPRAGWTSADPGGNWESPPCPRCGTAFRVQREHVDAWQETQAEPDVECTSCGHSGPLGDWESVRTVYLSHATFQFREWPWSLSPVFEHQLLTRLGPRSRSVYARW